MSKKQTKRNNPSSGTEAVIVERHLSAPHMATYLERIRSEALDRQGLVIAQARDSAHDVQRTIADLEDWRNEIEATIAFLKTMRR